MAATQAQPDLVESMGSQLSELYAERETLTKAFGPLNADQIVALVGSLEAQLVSLYEDAQSSAQPEPKVA